MCKTWVTYAAEEKCIRGFGVDRGGTRAFERSTYKWKYNIKVDLKAIG